MSGTIGDARKRLQDQVNAANNPGACGCPGCGRGGVSLLPGAPCYCAEMDTRCNRCGVKGEHHDWCERIGFTGRDVRLCPGDGCQGCFHCTSTKGESDVDSPAERGRNVERGHATALDGMEGQDGELAAAEGLPSSAELPGMVGRAGSVAPPDTRSELETHPLNEEQIKYLWDAFEKAKVAGGVERLLAHHTARHDALVAEAKAAGAAEVVARVEAVLEEHWDWKAGRALHAAVRAALATGGEGRG